jgi:hypothetical protein
MMNCDAARELLALEPTSENEALLSHLTVCQRCARYRRPQQALDIALRSELQWQTPAALTASLLALAALGPAALAVAPARVPPKRWYVIVVYLLTATAIGLSLAIAWQLVGMLAAQMGLGEALSQLAASAGQGYEQLIRMVPVSPTTWTYFLRAREQLLWLLAVAVLWAVVDAWNPQFSLRREQLQGN